MKDNGKGEKEREKGGGGKKRQIFPSDACSRLPERGEKKFQRREE